ncbi:MAG: hypothetical protein P8Y28_13730 [Gammaproteobacteria bacterium]
MQHLPCHRLGRHLPTNKPYTPLTGLWVIPLQLQRYSINDEMADRFLDMRLTRQAITCDLVIKRISSMT